MTYNIFLLTKKIRKKTIPELVQILTNEITEMEFQLDNIKYFALNGWTVRYMLHILARLTYYIEKQSGLNPDFENYVNRENRNSFDIEHIWADHFERHVNEFDTEEDFNNYRNKFGDLLILARDKNRSYNDYTYEEKLPLYYGENLLARSLNKQCYQNNPQFIRFFSEAGLPFKHYDTFNKTAIEDRQLLYQEIATKIWDVDNIRELAENHVK